MARLDDCVRVSKDFKSPHFPKKLNFAEVKKNRRGPEQATKPYVVVCTVCSVPRALIIIMVSATVRGVQKYYRKVMGIGPELIYFSIFQYKS